MIKTITLGNHPVEVNSSMGWLYVYRNQFGHDILPDIMPLLEAVLAGMGDVFTTIKDKEDITVNDAVKIMDSDAVVDMFIKLAGMEFTTLLNILWALAKNKDPHLPAPERFINQFDCLPVDELAPALAYLIIESSTSSKNLKSLLPKIEAVIPSVLTSSQSPESTED